MPASDVLTRLFCSHCGKRIGAVSVCPHCKKQNEFLDVTPPVGVWDDEPEQVSAAPPPRTAPSGGKLPETAAPAAAADEDDPTFRIVEEEDDPTLSLGGAGPDTVIAVLVCKEGCDDEATHELREGSTTVGRKGAQLLVKKETVSKKHAIFNVEKKNPMEYLVSVMDQGSENSTFVNDVRLEPNRPHVVKDQDIITFADVKFLYRLSPRVKDAGSK